MPVVSNAEIAVRTVVAMGRGQKCDDYGHFEPANINKRDKAYKIVNTQGKEYTLCGKCGVVLEDSLEMEPTEQGEWNYVPDSSRRSDTE